MTIEPRPHKVFISYSWDSDEHKNWVHNLASRLRADGVETILDQWHLIPGDQLPEFMERVIRESDFVLLVCTQRYKARSDSREGGVGFEGDIMTGEVSNRHNQRKFIPILRELPWERSAPTWVTGKYYIDLSANPLSESQYNELVSTILGTRPEAPPVRQPKEEVGLKQKMPDGIRESTADFRLVFRRSGGMFEIQAISEPHIHHHPVTIDSRALAPLGLVAEALRGRHDVSLGDAVQLGQELYKIIFAHSLRQALLMFLERARHRADKLRLVLEFTDTPELHELPWEFLNDGNQFLIEAQSLIRYTKTENTASSFTTPLPLRVFVTFNTYYDLGSLDFSREEKALKEAFSHLRDRVEVKIKRNPSLERAISIITSAKLDQTPYHIWHHVGAVEQRQSQPALCFGKPQQIQYIPVGRLNQELNQTAIIPLIFFDLRYLGDYPTGLYSTIAALNSLATLLKAESADKPTDSRYYSDFYQSLMSLPLEQASAVALRNSFGRGVFRDSTSLFTRTLHPLSTRPQGQIKSTAHKEILGATMVNIEIKSSDIHVEDSAIIIGNLGTSSSEVPDTNIKLDTEHLNARSLLQIGNASLTVEQAGEYFSRIRDLLDRQH